MKIIKSLLCTVLFISLTACNVFGDDYVAATYTIEGDRAIMNGVIDGTTPDRIQDLVDDYPEVKTIVMEQVDGSANDEANVEAARLVREYGLNTYLPSNGEIASGGVDFFLAGNSRMIENGARLGVHSWAAGDGATGAEIPKDDPQHQLYLDYYAEMGIPAEFYWFTLTAAPAEDMHWMTAEEIDLYGFVTAP